MSSSTFAALGVSEPVLAALATRGIEIPFDVQTAVLPDALEGYDVLVESPTGSGKTLAFGIPLVECLERKDGKQAGLVLAPTRELALQIVEDIKPLAHARGLTVAPVYGGVGLERQAGIARRANIIVATPGRLEDLIQRGAVRLDGVRIAVLDEADRMLDMGFKPAIERILGQTPDDRQTLLFSATLQGAPKGLAESITFEAKRHRVAARVERRGDIAHRFLSVAHEDKLEALVHELGHVGRTLVFVRTKRGADRLVKRLKAHDVVAVAMHGDKTQNQRQRALASFEAGKITILVATDVAARGLDVDDVTHVINFDAPEDRESYVHRTGRTGRAGRSGTAITLVSHDQRSDIGALGAALGLHAELEKAGLAPAHANSGPSRNHRGGGGQRSGAKPGRSRNNRSRARSSQR